MADLIDDIVLDLVAELSVTEAEVNETLVTSKVTNAVREVKSARNYPPTYTDEMIEFDLDNYYSIIRNIALYDYNTIGAEFQKSMNENSVSRTWVSRDSLFSGIIPLGRRV